MRTALVVLVLVACKVKDAPPPPPHKPGDAAVPADAAASDWIACENALRSAPKLPATRRVGVLLDACRPCGDWTPLLTWDKQQVDGGPTRAQIEAAMLACKGYCDANAKQRFLGTLDAARGKGTRGPWRFLGEMCKEQVSAVPDARFMSATYFALDRIARAVAARPDLAPLLDAIELPLPAISISGSGFELPSSPVTAPDTGPFALSVTATEIRIAAVPRAKLGPAGVTLMNKGEPYPGMLVKSAKDLEAALETLRTANAVDAAGSIAVYAPRGMAATRLVEALRLDHQWRLAVAADGGPPGWSLSGTIPVTLTTLPSPQAIRLKLAEDPDVVIKEVKALGAKLAAGQVAIEVSPKTTVGALAKLVGALVYFDVQTVALSRSKP